MASGALPPGFPPVKIDGEAYWDGGLVSNTPLQYVMESVPRRSRLIFQVDLFAAEGSEPATWRPSASGRRTSATRRRPWARSTSTGACTTCATGSTT